MKSDGNEKQDVITQIAPAVGKGCLLGISITGLFVVVGLICYGLALAFNLPNNIVLLIAIAGGPTFGTIIAMTILYRRSKRGKLSSKDKKLVEDETADRD